MDSDNEYDVNSPFPIDPDSIRNARLFEIAIVNAVRRLVLRDPEAFNSTDQDGADDNSTDQDGANDNSKDQDGANDNDAE